MLKSYLKLVKIFVNFLLAISIRCWPMFVFAHSFGVCRQTQYLHTSTNINRSLDKSVGIVTGHGLDGLGSIPNRGKIFLFSTASRPALGPTQPPIQWVPWVLSLGAKWPGYKADHSHPSNAEAKNRAATPLPCMSSWYSA
jgi:hypothetical protein